jgi:hypothetical protein
MEQEKTISKFDRAVASKLDSNNIHTKATTIENIERITGSAETFIVQTIRVEDGDYVSLKYLDNDGAMRILLPPKVVNTIVRQRESLSDRARTNSSKAAMKERIAAGEDVGKGLREWRKKGGARAKD